MPVMRLEVPGTDDATAVLAAFVAGQAMGIAAAVLVAAGLWPLWSVVAAYTVAAAAVGYLAWNGMSVEAYLSAGPCERIGDDAYPYRRMDIAAIAVLDRDGSVIPSHEAVHVGRDLLLRRVACVDLGDGWVCYRIDDPRSAVCMARELRRGGWRLLGVKPYEGHPWWRDVAAALVAASELNNL